MQLKQWHLCLGTQSLEVDTCKQEDQAAPQVDPHSCLNGGKKARDKMCIVHRSARSADQASFRPGLPVRPHFEGTARTIARRSLISDHYPTQQGLSSRNIAKRLEGLCTAYAVRESIQRMVEHSLWKQYGTVGSLPLIRTMRNGLPERVRQEIA